MVVYRGRWRITVVAKDSDWPQRVVLTGAAQGGPVIAGVVGTSAVVDGDEWQLDIQHNDGNGWSDNATIEPGPMIGSDIRMEHLVRTKDALQAGDTEPNDLVLRMEKLGPALEITARPSAIDASTLLMQADGIFVNVAGPQLMSVTVRNTWGRVWRDGEFALDVSPLGRATLDTFGVRVRDNWTPALLAATQQQLVGAAIRLPRIEVGATYDVYFLADSSAARRGTPEVGFILRPTAGGYDPNAPERTARRKVFIAELQYDETSGVASVSVPEGRLTLSIESIAVDRQALADLCRDVRWRLRQHPDARLRSLASANCKTPCDELTWNELVKVVCRCVGADGGHGGTDDRDSHGWQRVCAPGAIWFPLRFQYGVEVEGGFEGQFGPLMFADPWWKVALLILAALAWLVGLVASIVAEYTGWGNQGDHPRSIGTVGASNRTTTDACIIEYNGSRPAIQSVADAITGETNTSAIVANDTTITVDPQIALPNLAPASVIGHRVYKSGSRTGMTHGVITSIGPFNQCRGEFDEATSTCTPDAAHPDLSLPAQFGIATDAAFAEELFDDGGDSGSIVLSREPATMHQVIGLLHSGGGGTSPIQDVLSALNLRLQ